MFQEGSRMGIKLEGETDVYAAGLYAHLNHLSAMA